MRIVRSAVAAVVALLYLATAIARAEVSVLVRDIIGRGPNPSVYSQRFTGTHRLSDRLGVDDIRALLAFLLAYDVNDPLDGGALNAVKNDVVNALGRQAVYPDELTQTLCKGWRDTRQDPMWRDYCLQHLGRLYRRMPKNERLMAETALWNGVFEGEYQQPGTALLALRVNLERGIEAETLCKAAWTIAAAEQQPVAARVTALQLAAEMGAPLALERSREWMKRGSETALRCSAVAVVGNLGDATDLEFLRSISKSGDIRITQAARAAIGKIEERTGAEEP